MATKRKLACLTAEQKKEICVFHGNNTNKKQQCIIKALHQWAPSPGVTLVNTIKPATGLLGLFVYLATSLLAIIWLWPKCGEITGFDYKINSRHFADFWETAREQNSKRPDKNLAR